MRNARFSVFVWSIYLIITGVSLFLIPTQITQLLGIDTPQEVWIKVLGATVVIIGVHFAGGVLNKSQWMYRYSIFSRLIFIVALAYLAIADGPWQLWLFAIVDAVGALWTYVALRPRPVPAEETSAAV